MSSAADSEPLCSRQFYDQCVHSSKDRWTTTQGSYSEGDDTVMTLQTIQWDFVLQAIIVIIRVINTK